MKVNRLELRNYRNYGELNLTFEDGINIFLGANAQGKTNIAEAIYYASLARSHRTNQDSELISWNANEALIKVVFSRRDVENQLRFNLTRGARKKIFLNEAPIKNKELVGTLNTVLFSPEDLFLIKGAPSQRRRFLDGEISQASPAYYSELTKYNRLILQRNNLLKKIRERKARRDMVSVWDEQIAESAAKITTKRIEATAKLNMLANLIERRISANVENLAISYEIKGKGAENMTNDLASWYNEMLAKNIDEDILRGATSLGPHHDDLVLEVNGINLRSYGSQGQQRTGVLALKLAELEFIRSETGEYPVLLLDDVMSELDATRRRELMHFISRERIQTIVTATDEAYFPFEKVGAFFDVASGQVTRRKS